LEKKVKPDEILLLSFTKNTCSEIREKEAKDAAKILNVAFRENLNFKDGFFKNDEEHQLKLIQVIRKYKPEKLIILGDLFHSKYSINKTLQKKVEDLPELLKTNVELVLGNHDIGCNIKNIKIFDIRKTKNITFSHEPVNSENKKTLNICGHYHPKIYLKNKGDKLSFRCFAMDSDKNILYLPAFGDLTGGYPCKKSFKKWAIVSEEEIIEIKS